MNNPTIESIDIERAKKWAREAIDHYNGLLADMNYSAELVAEEANAAYVLLALIENIQEKP